MHVFGSCSHNSLNALRRELHNRLVATPSFATDIDTFAPSDGDRAEDYLGLRGEIAGGRLPGDDDGSERRDRERQNQTRKRIE